MILLLGARKKYESIATYLENSNETFFAVEAEKDQTNSSDNIKTTFVGYDNFFNENFYKNKHVTKIVNLRDQRNWLGIENKISTRKNLPQKFNEITLDFFSYKSVQNDLAKDLDIPVLDIGNKKIIVKLDSGYSGGDGFKVIEREEYVPTTNNFLQRYIEIDYTLAVQAVADKEGNIFPYCFHKIKYDNNSPKYCESPYFDIETKQITGYLKKLKTKLEIKDRLIFWQFIKEKNGFLYNLDFNCRPAGGFETGTFDRLIGDFNVLDFYLGHNKMPDAITFSNQVQLTYKYNYQFGYGPFDKKIIKKNKFKYEVIQI